MSICWINEGANITYPNRVNKTMGRRVGEGWPGGHQRPGPGHSSSGGDKGWEEEASFGGVSETGFWAPLCGLKGREATHTQPLVRDVCGVGRGHR